MWSKDVVTVYTMPVQKHMPLLHGGTKRYIFLYLLRVEWTKDGWIDTLEEEQVWDEDEYYAHIDNLDFDFD